MKTKYKYILLLSSLFILSCSDDFIPKPKGYNHIKLPKHQYTLLQDSTKPYTFEFSAHAIAHDDTTNWSQYKKLYKIIKYSDFSSKIYLTYKKVYQSQDSLDSYINEAYRLAYGHDKKAYAIEDIPISTKQGKNAVIFHLEGDVPSQYQFFVHDSTRNFMRGAIYFESATKNDSLKPVIDYVIEDVNHLIQTLEWKD